MESDEERWRREQRGEMRVNEFAGPRRATCGCTAFPTRRSGDEWDWVIAHEVGKCRGTEHARVLSWDEFVYREGFNVAIELDIPSEGFNAFHAEFLREADRVETITGRAMREKFAELRALPTHG